MIFVSFVVRHQTIDSNLNFKDNRVRESPPAGGKVSVAPRRRFAHWVFLNRADLNNAVLTEADRRKAQIGCGIAEPDMTRMGAKLTDANVPKPAKNRR